MIFTSLQRSPRAHLHVVGMLQFMFLTKPMSLPTPFYSVLVSISVVMVLSAVLHCINSTDNSPLSHSVFPASLILSTIYLFMKVSFSPNFFLFFLWRTGLKALTNQLTNYLQCVYRTVAAVLYVYLCIRLYMIH